MILYCLHLKKLYLRHSRRQADEVSNLLSKKMLSGWALLGETCPCSKVNCCIKMVFFFGGGGTLFYRIYFIIHSDSCLVKHIFHWFIYIYTYISVCCHGIFHLFPLAGFLDIQCSIVSYMSWYAVFDSFLHVLIYSVSYIYIRRLSHANYPYRHPWSVTLRPRLCSAYFVNRATSQKICTTPLNTAWWVGRF